ncbi:fatty acid hydroxylase [Marinomonas ushuaiensis DSM 15871]|uniref:Fatty acid hydroxylase n=1 Tax=Marinomonas ushuaiensis DSM 15871 TaxID=1122207 RepID=X7E4J4_9GAMM|nr:sterol desaturase family protein [Marinomonas ushuaiensis]ETX10959.1 fatty acid hydroxylase [Marinomonas ushuaiensis DSM 15871]
MIDFTLRISVFLFVFTLLLIWQWRCPRASLLQWRQRWRHNIVLLMLGALCVRITQPFLLSMVALFSQSFGLFKNIDLPYWSVILLSILLLDCLIYWQHRLFHGVPFLWRLHRVHHSDPELDVSSAIRFHPIEIVLSLVIKAIAVLLLGIPIEAVLIFDVLLNASAMFNHTNARLPSQIESLVQYLVITPDMHRIHHSRISEETNSNYGFFLSIWDAIFRSKREKALQGDENLNIGFPGTKTYQPDSLKDILIMPFQAFKKSDFKKRSR